MLFHNGPRIWTSTRWLLLCFGNNLLESYESWWSVICWFLLVSSSIPSRYLEKGLQGRSSLFLPFFLVLHLIVMHQCNFAMHPGYTYVHFSRAVSPTSQEKGQYVSDSLPQLYYYVYFTKYSYLSNYFKIHIPLIPVVVYCSIASAEHKCYCGRVECCMLCDFP